MREIERLKSAADKTYNGWTNYETWCVKLWLDNDEYLCNELQPAMVRRAWAESKVTPSDLSFGLTREVNAWRDLADDLKSYCEDPENGLVPDLGASFASDLLNAAMSEIDWRSIAEHLLDELSDEERTKIDSEGGAT